MRYLRYNGVSTGSIKNAINVVIPRNKKRFGFWRRKCDKPYFDPLIDFSYVGVWIICSFCFVICFWTRNQLILLYHLHKDNYCMTNYFQLFLDTKEMAALKASTGFSSI